MSADKDMLATTQADSARDPGRDPVWDTVRGVGILCVVAAHSVGPYVSRPLPGLLWPVYEPVLGLWKQDAALGPAPGATDIVFWTIRAFTVPMFFFVAGVFARQSLDRTAPRTFLRARIARLGLPLLAGYSLVMPVVYVVWVWGWVRYGYAAWEHLRHFHFGPAVQQHLHGFGHLWYLWYSLLMCAGAAAVWAVRAKEGGNAEVAEGAEREEDSGTPKATQGLLHSMPSSSSAFLPGFFALCALIPVAALLPTAVRVFENGFVPRLGFFLFHAVFFVWGLIASRGLMHPSGPARAAWARWSPVLLLAGTVCAILMLRTLHPALHIKQNEPPPEMLPTRERWIVGVLAAVAGVAMVMGVVGACVRVSRGGTGTASRATPYLWHSGLWHRYLSHLGRASLWVYVTHLPWVGLAAVVMFGLRVPGDVKALAAFVFALTMSMLTCRLFTGTRVGRWLGA